MLLGAENVKLALYNCRFRRLQPVRSGSVPLALSNPNSTGRSSAAALDHLYSELTTFDDDSALDEIVPSTGLTRADTIAQVLLAQAARQL